jgi:phosphoribosylformimino-5-aminoimidazole carboxamide ribotide isomerase
MARAFDVIPAIDLRGGHVVRLQQGDFQRETIYADDPQRVAQEFAEAGAEIVHVVDLDGARAGEPTQLDRVSAIAAVIGVEAAGGIRSITDVDAAFQAGARRVVLGTAALRDSELVRAAVTAHGTGAVAIAIDVRDGRAVGHAWQSGDGPPATEVIHRLADAGATWFEVTAIDRDGLLGGPDLDLLERVVAIGRGHLIASAGIRDVADLVAVRDLGCAGAIVGRALYEGRLDLRAAITSLAAS